MPEGEFDILEELVNDDGPSTDTEGLGVKVEEPKFEPNTEVLKPGISVEEAVVEVLSKSELQRQIGNILAEYGMRESDIPITHEYWELCNQYRGMP